MRAVLLLISMILALSACERSYDAEVDSLKDFFRKNRIGDGAEFMLTKTSSLGPSDVAVVFGYMDDSAGCNDIARLLNAEYPDVSYYCTPMN